MRRWADSVSRKVFWRYDLPKELTAGLKKKSRLLEDMYPHDKPTRVTGNGRDSVGYARNSRGRQHAEGDPILMRGDNMAAVSWVLDVEGRETKGRAYS